MSDETDAELDYPYLEQIAKRRVVHDVLEITATLGSPPGDHHFYIEFLTGASGVRLSPTLKAQYPERMTIVLQHQFEDLLVTDDRFEVTLHFKGVPDHLVIPYAAITQFFDPSVNYAVRFPQEMLDLGEGDDDASGGAGHEADIEDLAAHRPEGTKPEDDPTDDGPDDQGPDDQGPGGGSAEVVSLDRFRKK